MFTGCYARECNAKAKKCGLGQNPRVRMTEATSQSWKMSLGWSGAGLQPGQRDVGSVLSPCHHAGRCLHPEQSAVPKAAPSVSIPLPTGSNSEMDAQTLSQVLVDIR